MSMIQLPELSDEDIRHLLEDATDIEGVLTDSGSIQDDDTAASTVALPADSKHRARRSMIEKESRRRRQATLRSMRAQAKQLDRQLGRLAAELLEQSVPEWATTALALKTSDPDSRSDLCDKYLALTLVMKHLLAEEFDLKQKLLVQQQFSASLRSILIKSREEWAELSWQTRVNHHYETVPDEDIFRVMHDCFNTISNFELSTDYVTSGMTFLGWRDRRRLDEAGGVINFSFSKFFPGRLAEPMMVTSWEFFTDGERLKAEAAEAHGRFSFRILQRPNDDVVLLQQAAQSRDGPRILSVMIVFRLRVGDDFMIVTRTFPMASAQPSLQADEMWIDMFYWIHFKSVADGAETTWGGSMAKDYFPSMSEFLVTSFGSVVSWENQCVTPMIILGD
ncbi:hypothetical protein PINS_up004025 [Pythium insidiosum]|nr:hypothetical protein PINS_up004025 [Pythium insidiosum]